MIAIIVLIITMLTGIGARLWPTSHILAWTYEADAVGFVLSQCLQTREGCVMVDIAALDGEAQEIEVVGLQRRKVYCWQVRLSDTQQMSNTVCTSR